MPSATSGRSPEGSRWPGAPGPSSWVGAASPRVEPLSEPTTGQWLGDMGLLAARSAAFLALAAWALSRSVARGNGAR